MEDMRTIRHAAWGGLAGLILAVTSIVFFAIVAADPTDTDASILDNIAGDTEQALAPTALILLGPAVALLLWFAAGLARYLAARDPAEGLTAAVIPGMALFAGLLFAGLTLDLSSILAASWTDRFTADADTARLLGVAGAFLWLGSLVGGAVVVAATSRVGQRTGLLPAWAVWLGYAVALVCLFGVATYGLAMPVFGLWLLGAEIGLLRATRPTAATVRLPAQPGVPTGQPTPTG